MIQRRIAIHEAGHAVMAHYSGMEITKMALTKEGGETDVSARTTRDRFLGIKHLYMTAAGIMTEFMSCGEIFWTRNPKSLLRYHPDIEKLMAFNFIEISTKVEIKKTLFNLHTYLSNPGIWGKIESLADALRDSPNGSLDNDDIEDAIIKSLRQRIPEHDPAPLIDVLVDELFREKGQTTA